MEWLVIMTGMYFAPYGVALLRRTSNRMSVGVINFFLGWTIIGWVIALAMAVSNAPTRRP